MAKIERVGPASLLKGTVAPFEDGNSQAPSEDMTRINVTLRYTDED